MKLSAWLVLDPEADRSYIAMQPPIWMARGPATRVYRIEIDVPEPVPVDGVLLAQAVDTQMPESR